jgi:phage/plasmid-associated DNA primase
MKTVKIPPLKNKFSLKLIDKNNTDLNKTISLDKPFLSYAEFLKYLSKKIESYKKQVMLLTGKNVLPTTAKSTDVFKIIHNFIDIRFIEVNTGNAIVRTFFIQDYDNPMGLWKVFNLKELIVEISECFEVSDINRTYTDVMTRLQSLSVHTSKFKKLNLPPNHIILAKNVVINLKNMEMSTDVNMFGNFNFINHLDYNIVLPNNVNPVMSEIIKRIFDDWSQNDTEKKHYLKQLSFAALDGNGRGVFNVIIGSGGNGKSSFLNMLEELSGKKYTKKLNLQDYMDDSKILGLDQTTKLLVGHDLATSAKLSSALNSRFKELVTNEAFLIDVKYEHAKLIQSHCLKIQSTNTLLDIFENTDAMKRRLRLFEWTNQNFSKITDENTFNLDELIGTAINSTPNKDFYEAFISFIFTDMNYFDKFAEIESITKATNAMVNDSDAVYNFLNWAINQEIDQFYEIPLNFIYELYKQWHWQENPSGHPLKQRGFTDRLSKLLDNYGYTLSVDQKKISTFDKLKFNEEVMNLLFFDKPFSYNNKLKTRYIKKHGYISEEEVKSFKLKMHTFLSLDELTTRQLIILYYLCDQQDTEAISLKNS